MKKLKVFVKRTTLKVKIQNGTLRKLHKKIIMYERLIQKVRDMSNVILIFTDWFNSVSGEKEKPITPVPTQQKSRQRYCSWIWLF